MRPEFHGIMIPAAPRDPTLPVQQGQLDHIARCALKYIEAEDAADSGLLSQSGLPRSREIEYAAKVQLRQACAEYSGRSSRPATPCPVVRIPRERQSIAAMLREAWDRVVDAVVLWAWRP